MTRIIETQMHGEAHFVINLAVVKLFTKDHEDFIYIGDKSQISALAVRTHIPRKKYIPVQHFAKKWQIPFYIVFHFFIIIKELIRSGAKDTVVFTSLFPVTHFLIKRFFFLSSAQKYIVLHGELKYIEVYKNRWLKILGKFLHAALLHKVKGVKYIVLGDNIRDIVLSKKWLYPQEIINVEHPYDFDSALPKHTHPEFIKLASIGAASFNKGSQHFIELAQKNTDSKLRFEIIGALTDRNLKPLLHEKILFSEDRFINSSDYNESLAGTDLAVFFLDDKEYAYSASGSFLDAVKYKIPIFAVTNDYFNSYFNKYGDMGILFKTPDELKRFILHEDIRSVLQNNREKWELNCAKIIRKSNV